MTPRAVSSSTLLLPLVLLLGLGGCEGCDGGAGPGAPRLGRGELRLVVAYGSEKKTWLEEQARRFEATRPTTASGRAVRIDARAMGSGEATQAILRGELKPHVFSPASTVYLTLLDDGWLAQPGHPRPLCGAGEPLVLSPIVIALWRPMAEALGWPDRSLGWKELLTVAVDRRGWGAVGHPEWGRFKLGHTHPEYSTSGMLAVLAEAYAGAGKTRRIEREDLAAARTQELLATVEGSIVHYGKSTGFFTEKMQARGPAYLSATVTYENLVIESYGSAAAAGAYAPLVALYPREGTFWSDHPYAILDAAWVGDEERQAARDFLAFLKARPQQERALALGFRPADPAIAIGAPVDKTHGVDARQPQTLLEVPDAPTLNRLLEVWRTTKRSADVTLVFDKSGSMAGAPLTAAKRGALTFLDGLGGRDRITLVSFDGRVHEPDGPWPVAGDGDGRARIRARVEDLQAYGGTALYDAIAVAHERARRRAQQDPSRSYAVVVMTDGADQSSRLALDVLEQRFATATAGDGEVRVYTIAYGGGANRAVLQGIADAAGGASADGDVGSILSVFQDMAAFF